MNNTWLPLSSESTLITVSVKYNCSGKDKITGERGIFPSLTKAATESEAHSSNTGVGLQKRAERSGEGG